MSVNRRKASLRLLPTTALVLATIVLGIFMAPRPVSAQMTIGDYSRLLSAVGAKRQDAAKAEDALGYLRDFHGGMDSGLAVANAAFVQAGGKPSFCLPAGAEASLILMSKVAKRLLDDKDWSKQDRVSVGQVAISILTADHPCK